MPKPSEEALNEVRPPRSKRSRAGRFFLRGLVALLPAVLTIFVIVTIFQFASNYVTGPINKVIYWGIEHNTLGWRALDRMGIDPYSEDYLDTSVLPLELKEIGDRDGYRSENFRNQLALHRTEREGVFFRNLKDLGVHAGNLRDAVQSKVHPMYAVILSLLIIFWSGWLVSGFFGRGLVTGLDKALSSIPGVRAVYPYSKQLVEFFFAERQLEFDTVVAIPYPSKGLWSLGFVTGPAVKTAREKTDLDLVFVFVPSSPMPMTGYTIMVEAHRLIPLPITVDEALRITITGGVVVPPGEKVDKKIESLVHAGGAGQKATED